MPSITPTLLLPILTLFTLSANARPTTATATVETWSIPRLTMHMMTPTTGLPGGAWPPSLRFNSTIDFDILVPDHSAAASETAAPLKMNCIASWENGTLPEGRMGSVYGSGERRPELSFVLSVWKGETPTLTGSVPITANDPSEPSSYLTCLGGAPLDGLRCNIGSYLSVRKELVIQGS
ncbi:hypothetical protein PTNB73_02033 [Pyrenophora teres f. teres]|nr:hypothetical protein PTNB73_02033 [Pyrenophora teres f. teres]